MKFKVVGALACVLSMSVSAGQIDIVNANGTIDNQFMSSNGGLGTQNFAGGFDNGVSVWLRARNSGTNDIFRNGNTFFLNEFSGNASDDFSFEFQFTPAAGATLPDNDYFVQLKVDNDPTAGVDWSGALLEGTISEFWSGGDSYSVDGVTSRNNTGLVEFADTSGNFDVLPDYVVTNSWKPKWNFLLGNDFGGAPGAGLYDISLSAFNLNDNGEQGTLLNSVQITAQVGDPVSVSEPGPLALLLTAGLASLRLRRKRK
ncbi:PEP-CTERM sorting domain-containing protein [Salinimonas chungwhensis]|uniref:PEP-CTERM sorting domain-containing protein n=1 Tax=Salinimonas chungwhensis TaxID=265425 RepID=UPI000367D7BE|nr:PEP-CTERM sorting domain-containing protein [Salinimonas chungwhensis]